MELKEILTLAALPISILSLAISFWSAWFNRTVKLTEIRGVLLRQYTEVVRQLENIAELHEEFNHACAREALAVTLDTNRSKAFVKSAQDALREVEELPTRKILIRFHNYSHHAETLVRHIAMMDEHLRNAIKDIKHESAS